MTTDNKDELKPCPLCGCEATSHKWLSRYECIEIFCDTSPCCGARMSGEAETTIKAWNTRAQPAVDDKWQPIETAPKDGTALWLWDGQMRDLGYWVVFFRDKEGRIIGRESEDIPDLWGWVDPACPTLCEPTHWMPLPDPPKGEST